MSLSVLSSTTGASVVAAPEAGSGYPRGTTSRASGRDRCPQCIQSFAAGCRNRQGGHAKHVSDDPQVARPLGARQLVHFGGDDLPVDPMPSSHRAAREVGLEPRMARVDQQQRRPAARPPPPGSTLPRPPAVRPPNCPRPARSRSRAGPRCRRTTGRARPRRPRRDPIEVREPGLARRRAGARDLRPAQRVDQARLPDIRPAGHRDLREPVVRDAVRPPPAAALVTKSAERSFKYRRRDRRSALGRFGPRSPRLPGASCLSSPIAQPQRRSQCVMVSSEMAGSTSASGVDAAAARTGSGPARAIFSTSSIVSTM